MSLDSADGSADKGVEYARVKSRVRGGLFGGPAHTLRIGRFAVLERLGQGGMSIVYAAYDDELDRKVALKLLRPEGGGPNSSARLRREAQAIARLSHANVVPVYEVGEHEGRVFIAMEFVRGATLRQWLDPSRRDWDACHAVLLQAAEGLAAAHRAGVVHRDFKPDNVMVDEEGRVRVLDFGVAAIDGDERAHTWSDRDRDDQSLTRDGAIVGTPLYMAPECLAGEPASPLSDQYSFAAVCFEALAGRRPHHATTLTELERATTREAVFPPDTAAPSSVRAALLRALHPDAAQRHPDMDALLAALRVRKTRRTWIPVTAAGLLTTAAVVGWASAERRDECAAARDALTAVWSPAQKARVREASLREQPAVSLRTWESATEALDRYAADWATTQTQSCGLNLDGEAALEHALCFEWLVGDLAGVVDTIRDGDTEALSMVPGAVTALVSPDTCLDARAMADLAEVRRRKSSPAPEGLTTVVLSDFEAKPYARFGAGWAPSTDVLAGGVSRGHMARVEGGHDSRYALQLSGEVRGGDDPLWSGALVFPGERHFAPANLQDAHTLSFWGTAEPGHYAIMVFTARGGFEPAFFEYQLEQRWQRVQVDLDALIPERYDVTAIFFGRVRPGRFEMRVDDVQFH